MGIFRQFPYSNFHEMNMDEIIKIVKNMLEEWAQYYNTWDNWKEQVTQEWSDMQDFINNYFDNLNVQTEINNKITAMVNSGEFGQIVNPYVPPAVASWLADHITQPVGVVIDTSLSVAGACADAKATGDAIRSTNDSLDCEMSENFKEYSISDSNIYTDGVEYHNPVTFAGYKCTDYIKCYPTSKIMLLDVWTGASSLAYAFYDKDRVFISGQNSVVGNVYDVTIPNNTAFVRFCGRFDDGYGHTNDTKAYIFNDIYIEENLNYLIDHRYDDYITPEFFGAVGDGVTDDTDAIEAVFNSGKNIVILKNGATYLVSSPQIINVNNVTVIGYGATIKANKDFTFSEHYRSVCLYLDRCVNIKFEGVTFDASWDEIQVEHNLDVDTSLENHCVQLNEANIGITFYKCSFGNQLRVCIQSMGSYLGGDISDPSSVDPNFNPNRSIDIGYCRFGQNYTPGLHNCAIQFLELPQVETDVNCKIHDNLIEQSGTHGMHIYHGNNNIIIENNTVLNSGHSTLEDYHTGGSEVVKGYGIEVTSCNKITIKNNYVHNSVASLIAVFNDAWYTDGYIHDIIIEGNIISQDSSYTDEFEGNGISLVYCKTGTVCNNTIYNIMPTADHGSTQTGVTVNNSEKIIVSNNIITDCQEGIFVINSNTADICENIIKNPRNPYGNTLGMDIYNANILNIMGNMVIRGSATWATSYGMYITNVTDAIINSNKFRDLYVGIKQNGGTNSFINVFGCNMVGTGTYYVWQGTHDHLKVDFVDVP